jgi:Domain of unknown function (DUF4331)
MSHHASGPNFGFPRGDARLDMIDLYAFLKPGDPAKSVIVLNVHPSFALSSPEPTTSEPFKPGALYEFKVETNGDAVADTATVGRTQGARAVEVCDGGEVIVENAPVSVEREALVTKAGDYRFFFGWRSDSFFLDVNGNFNHMQFTGGPLLQGQKCLQHRDRIAQLGFGDQEDGNLDAHSGQNWRRLGAGRPRWKTLASGFPSRREERGVPQRGASG